jgi:multidrug efflux system membrane fusion protein
LLVVLALAAGCERTGQAKAPPPRPPAKVSVVEAVSADVPIYLDQIGKMVAVESVSIIPQVGGKVIRADVQHGDYVKKKDLLFEIDPRPFEAALASAQATLQQNRAEWALANSEYKRILGLQQQGSANEIEVEQKRAALGVSDAKAAAAEAAIDTAKLNLEYARIYSPLGGRAGVRMVDAGNVVKANEGVMLVIQRLDPIYVEFTVTENDLGTVRRFMAAHGMAPTDTASAGLTVTVDLPADSQRVLAALGSSTDPGTAVAPATKPATSPTTQPHTYAGPREGKLTFLDNSVQSESGTIKLRATIPNADRYFWPGQFVKARLVLSVKKDAVLIPTAAPQVGQQGSYVYVVQPNGTAQIRPITLGQRQGEQVVVEKGLAVGERVVINGQMGVIPGGPVQVAQ